MKQIFFSLLIVYTFVLGCNKSIDEPRYFKAKVVQTSDVSCLLPVLDFSEDVVGIRNFTNRDEINYTVLNLPSSFNIQNKLLFVEVTALKSIDEIPCNTFGITYPRLKILAVKDR